MGDSDSWTGCTAHKPKHSFTLRCHLLKQLMCQHKAFIRLCQRNFAVKHHLLKMINMAFLLCSLGYFSLQQVQKMSCKVKRNDVQQLRHLAFLFFFISWVNFSWVIYSQLSDIKCVLRRMLNGYYGNDAN